MPDILTTFSSSGLLTKDRCGWPKFSACLQLYELMIEKKYLLKLSAMLLIS